ncbi:hypothetical protein AYI70_g3445 [Smittium culicis]|uniref:Uncharacterized protein n=1 Tax=Smittium culicis TaxID=133412 RepID=A0A1R1Y3T3_9FUNG|nr:hypothetical protein AYI70_g3445 [Smittium culicis]
MQYLDRHNSSKVASTSQISKNSNDINQYYAHMFHLASSFVHKALLHSKLYSNQESSSSLQKRPENICEAIETSTTNQGNLSDNEAINTAVTEKKLIDIAKNENNISNIPTFESSVSESDIIKNIKIDFVENRNTLDNFNNLETDIFISSVTKSIDTNTGSLANIETNATIYDTPINNTLGINSIDFDPSSLENMIIDTNVNGNTKNDIVSNENIENEIVVDENLENLIVAGENIEFEIFAEKSVENEISAQRSTDINVDISENTKISNDNETNKFPENSNTASICIDNSPTDNRKVDRSCIISAISVLDSLCVPNTPAPVERLARLQLALIYNKWSIDPKIQEKHLTRALLLTPICPNADRWKLLINISLIDLYISNKDYSFALNRLDEMINSAKE